MRLPLRPTLRLVGVALLLAGSGALSQHAPALAQPKPAETADDSPAVVQTALTDKQVEGLLAGEKDIAAATAKIPEGAMDKPDPKVQATLDTIARKYGFGSYAEYDGVVSNVALVMSGFDPETKSFIGPDAVLKKEIAAVKADKQLPATDKKKAIDELETSLKTAPSIQFPGNIKVVGKYYDRLSQAMQQDQ